MKPSAPALTAILLLVAGTACAADTLPMLDRSVFDRQDMIYGSEIGAWNQDGGNAVNNAECRKKVTDAGIRVIRWAPWTEFDYMKPGTPHTQSVSQFRKAIDGIRSVGAYPFIKLPPVWDMQCEGTPNAWSLSWQKEIIKNAGSHVQLYEFANEPNHYCHWSGTAYAQHWNDNVPQLKAYARSLGFEIYMGGPAWANSYPKNLAEIKEFLDGAKAAYVKTGNRDYIPDYISTHTYLTEKENSSIADMQHAIDGWGKFYDNLRTIIDEEFSGMKDTGGKPIAPQIKIVDSEYNFTINHSSALQNDPLFTDAYMKAMMAMFRAHHIWMANQFTIASHHGDALDMLTDSCAAKPLYNSYKAISTTDPVNSH